MKVYTYGERKDSTKGRKDLIDIFSLIKEDKIDWQKYGDLIKKHNLEKINQDFKNLISSVTAIPELNLLNHQTARLKKKVLENL